MDAEVADARWERTCRCFGRAATRVLWFMSSVFVVVFGALWVALVLGKIGAPHHP